ncbi:MAG TPA: 50S ribosomal protein L11 methyltransferase [Geminicoccus sp.]|uniref:50S ribosomal protein L11 methyltransferase n=1 Tax=Geminicoccus sp. TaxID=2024832 RepID=UPI002E36CD8D|nr:50S ribosomal protein L11 methyltransferase [Geminicoccus sp.]HEX2526976.1 50S ribosomal protein L11 methyltransferase [Geminicoccus sp.]
MSNVFHATTGSLWRTSFVLDDGLAQAVFERLDELGLSAGMFEHEGDGGFTVERWRMEIVEAERPKLAAQRERLLELVGDLIPDLPDLAIEEITEAAWTEAMRREFPPVEAGRFYVHGSAQADQVPPDRIAIQIDAGLAFGSGEHATTKGCLLAFDRVLHRRAWRRILDMGTGSGILAIAAAKATRATVLAVDVDPVAVEVAAENVRTNGAAHRVTCRAGDGFATPGVFHPRGHDLIFANILANPLVAMADSLARALAPGGVAILSGLIDEQAARVEAAFRRTGLRSRRRLLIDRWVIITLRQPR